MLFSIYKATRLSAEYRARALFQIADIFFEDWSPNSLGNSLADHCGAREIWFELIRQFSFKNRWVERAFYELAKYYESPFEKHDNKVMYSYLKRAGRFGRVYFSYARNLLSGLPGNSILMTEGGDNQVFGMQMLTRLEKVRPDVSVYDQKGNIFTKIYGDFHYIRSSFVSLRKTIVDHTLFSGGNPVFLTWERSPSVATCGDFSLARQGMLWRVVPLRYKLLRILPRFSMQNNISISKVQYVAQLLYKNKRRMKALKENFGKVKKFFSFYKKGKLHFINAGSRARIMNAAASYKRFARNALTRKIDSRFVKKILLKLTQEKLIQVQGDTIKILRWSPLKDSLAIWKQYKFLHAVYKDVAGWPYLLREIVVNDYFYLMQICQDQLRQVEYSKRYGMISADRANAMRIRIKHILGGSQKKLLRFSHDMWTVRYNIAILLLRKKLYKKALALLEPFAKPTYFGKSALSLYLWLKLQVATLSSDPAQELAALVLIRKKLKQVRASLYKQFPGGKGERIYRQYFRYVIRISRMRSQNSLSQQKRLMKLALRSGAEEDCMRFFLHCSNRFDFLKIIAFFEKRADLKWKNEKLALQYIIAAALVGPPPKAYQVLEKGMRLFPNNRIMRLYKESIEQKLVQ